MEHFPIQKFMKEYEQQNPKAPMKKRQKNFSSLSAFKEEFLKIYVAQRQGDQRHDRNFTLSWGKYSELKKKHFQYRSFDGSNVRDGFLHKNLPTIPQSNSATPKFKTNKMESDRWQTDPGFTEKIDTLAQGFYLKSYWANSTRGKQSEIKSPLRKSETQLAESINLEDNQGNKGSAIYKKLEERFAKEFQPPVKNLEKSSDYFEACPYRKNPRRRPKIITNLNPSEASTMKTLEDTFLGNKAQSPYFHSASPTKTTARNGKDFSLQELEVKAQVLRNIKQIDEEIIRGLTSKSPTTQRSVVKLPKIQENVDKKEKHITYQNQARTLKPSRKAV